MMVTAVLKSTGMLIRAVPVLSRCMFHSLAQVSALSAVMQGRGRGEGGEVKGEGEQVGS